MAETVFRRIPVMFSAGYDNFISAERVAAISGNPSAAPAKKYIAALKTESPFRLIDFTNGNAVQSIIYMADGSAVLSAMSSKTLAQRYAAAASGQNGKE